MARKKSCDCNKSSSINGIDSIDFEQLAAVGVGAVAAKAVDGVASNVEFLQDKPWLLGAIKLAAGAYGASTAENEMLTNACIGIAAVGALDLVEEFAPQVFTLGDHNGDTVTTRLAMNRQAALNGVDDDYIPETHIMDLGIQRDDYAYAEYAEADVVA